MEHGVFPEADAKRGLKKLGFYLTVRENRETAREGWKNHQKVM